LLTRACGRFAAFVLDRPRKLWHCAETNRWFRFRASYNAHVRLLEKKKQAGILDYAKHFVHLPRVHFSFIGLAMEISLVYHITMFVLIPNAFMALSGFKGVPSAVPVALLSVPAVGLLSTWHPVHHGVTTIGAIVSVLLALGGCGMLAFVVYDQSMAVVTCTDLMESAYGRVQQAQLEGETVSYGEVLREAQRGEGLSCTFTDLSDYAQSIVFCLVQMALLGLCFLSGCCYVCARNHLVSDSMRKALLKESKKGTAKGAEDGVVEAMGGVRSDGLGSSERKRWWAKLRRWEGTREFKVIVVVGLLAGVAGSGWVMTGVGQELRGMEADSWEFSECGASSVDCCGGLESNCDKRLDEITIAAVHNSMSNAEDLWIAPNNR